MNTEKTETLSPTPGNAETVLLPSVADQAGDVQFQNDKRTCTSHESVRLISFSDHMSWEMKRHLANIGIFLANVALLVCHFCEMKYDVHDDVNDVKRAAEHKCAQRCEGNKPLPQDETNLRFEINRIITFIKNGWTKEVSSGLVVGALDLARSGFFYTGVADAVRCIFCRLEVRNWEEGDSAEKEHKIWNKYCPFLCGRQVNNIEVGHEYDYLEHVTEDAAAGVMLSIPKYTDTSDIAVNINKSSDEFEQMVNSLEPTTEELTVANTTEQRSITPRYLKYLSQAARWITYEIWPKASHPCPLELCKAGFFYTGRGDRVICFYCGGGLKDWTAQEQPWTEHAFWFPRCPYLIEEKGLEFIKKVYRLKRSPISEENAETLSSTMDETNEVSARSEENICVSNIDNDTSLALKCKVCKEKDLNIVLLPCGHMVVCASCLPRLVYCPACEQRITASCHAYLG